MIAVHDSYTASIAVTARLSSLGYSGEHFDAKAGQQYLRARFYNPANGRFNRLDPFAGNMQDPQSLHKYSYAHGDPVQGIDPSGLQFSVGGLGVAIGIGASIGGLVGGGVGYARTGTLEGTLRGAAWGAAIGGLTGLAIYTGAWGLARFVGIPLRDGTALQGGLRSFSRFFNDPRTFNYISRRYFAGNAGGRSLHHWLLPQRLGRFGLPQGIQNAGFNLLNMPGFQFLGRFSYFRNLPAVGGLNQWMGLALSPSWGGGRIVVELVIENGIRVLIPVSIFGTSATVTSAVDWALSANDSEEFDLGGGVTAAPLELSRDEAIQFEEEVARNLNEIGTEANTMKNQTSFTAAFFSDVTDPNHLLTQLHAIASQDCDCSEVDDWCGTGATFQMRQNDGRRLTLILAQLFDSELGNFFLTVAVYRRWFSWFSTPDLGFLNDVRSKLDDWFQAIDVKEVRWSKNQIADFTVLQDWE